MPTTHKILSSSILLVLFTTLVGCNDDKAQVTTPQVETPLAAQTQYRVYPYLQNPSHDAMSILWLSEDDQPVTVMVEGIGTFKSQPVLAKNLDYSENIRTFNFD